MPLAKPRRQIRGAAEFAEVFGVSRETLARLESYAALLAQWQPTINLVAAPTLDAIWHRHFADSAQLLMLADVQAVAAAKAAAPAELHWLDLGAGGGFPGLVVAILLAETCTARVSLVESDQRKCAFLREAARVVLGGNAGTSGVAVDIHNVRIESAANHIKIRSVDIVSARALAALPRLFDLAAPHFASGTTGLFMKGRGVAAEIAAAAAAGTWAFDAEVVASLTDAEAGIVVVRRLVAAGHSEAKSRGGRPAKARRGSIEP